MASHFIPEDSGLCHVEEVLHNPGPSNQRSGTGPNNYRTNLLEALIGSLGDRVSKLQLLWQHVNLSLAEIYADSGDDLYSSPQNQLIASIVADTSDTSTFTKQLICRVSNEKSLDLFTYCSHLKKLTRSLVNPHPPFFVFVRF